MVPSPLSPTSNRRIPLVVKLAFSVFVALHVFFNCRYSGPLDLLWFCDVAVITTLVALWTENRLLISVANVAILLPMLLWIFDLSFRILFGRYLFGIAGYMFDRRLPHVIRILSWFHVWMPLLLMWAVHRFGYDRRAIWVQTSLVIVLLLICRAVSVRQPAPLGQQGVNINWVFGPDDDHTEQFMPLNLYFLSELILFPLMIYGPTHLALRWLLGRKHPNEMKSAPLAPANSPPPQPA